MIMATCAHPPDPKHASPRPGAGPDIAASIAGAASPLASMLPRLDPCHTTHFEPNQWAHRHVVIDYIMSGVSAEKRIPLCKGDMQ